MDSNIPWGPVGYITAKRTYCRKKDNGKTETFTEVIDRVIKAGKKQLKIDFEEGEEELARNYFLRLKGSTAGRFLWQLGTKTVDKLGLASLQNCCFTKVDQPVEPFCWTMDFLMLGAGVGASVQREHVYKLPKVLNKNIKVTREDTKDANFIVPDSREGWVELLRKTLQAHFYTGKSFSYSTMLIRGKGAPIKGFGGVASGPEELCWGIEKIDEILNNRRGKQLRPIDCLDIICIIGFIVVAGNIRRSAILILGDADDVEFLNAKRWDLGNIPNWRAMSNNTVVTNNTRNLLPQFWDGYHGNGEPYGLFNLELCRKIGRLGEEQYPDPDVEGVNPCAEQNLEDREVCCLAELFMPMIGSEEELFAIAKILYKYCKHSLALKCHNESTDAVVKKNRRMGIGATGLLQMEQEKWDWLDRLYVKLRQFDEEYSAAHGMPRSIKLTTVKPSGSLSLLPGITPGIHPGFSQYFIRRIRVASNSPLVRACEACGYDVEFQRNFDGSQDHNTVVVSFPCSYPEGTVLAKDMTAVEQLKFVEKAQRIWSDNAVSCTVYYRKEEIPAIQEYLAENFTEKIKSVSFLLHQDHGFDQAPYEEITKEQYDAMIAGCRPMDESSVVEFSETDITESFECLTGACPVR